MILVGGSFAATAVEQKSSLITVCSEHHGHAANTVKQTLYPRPTGIFASTYRVFCSHAA